MRASFEYWLAMVAALTALTTFTPLARAASVDGAVATSQVKIGDVDARRNNETDPTAGAGGHNIAVSGGTVYAAYTAENAAGEREVRLATSIDGGLTWGAAEVIAHDPAIMPGGAGIAVGRDTASGLDIVHVAWEVLGSYGTTVYYARSLRSPYNDYVWSTPIAASGSLGISGSRSIAVDTTGAVHIAYRGQGALISGYQAVYYSHSTDGTNFDEIGTQISPYAYWAFPSNISVDAGGTAYVAWRSGDYASNGATFVAVRSGGSAQWTASSIESPAVYDPPSLALCDSSHIYVGAIAPTGAVEVLATANGGLSWTTSVVAPTSTYGGRPALVASPGCSLAAVYPTSNGIVVSHNTTSGSWTKAIVLSPDQGISLPNAAIDASSKVIVSYKRKGLSGTTIFSAKER